MKFSKQEIETMLFYIEPRIKSIDMVLSPRYAEQFFSNRTQAEVDEIHAERLEEREHIETIIEKLKGAL